MGFLLDGVHPSDQFGPVNFIPFEGMPPMEGPVARQFQHGTLGCRFATAFQHGLEVPSKVRMADVRIQPRRGFQPSTAVRAGFGIQVHDLPDLIFGHWIPHRPWMTGLPTRFASGRFLWNLTTAHI